MNFLIKERENVGAKHLNDLKVFIECWNKMDDVYENIDDCKPATKIKISCFLYDKKRYE